MSHKPKTGVYKHMMSTYLNMLISSVFYHAQYRFEAIRSWRLEMLPNFGLHNNLRGIILNSMMGAWDVGFVRNKHGLHWFKHISQVTMIFTLVDEAKTKNPFVWSNVQYCCWNLKLDILPIRHLVKIPSKFNYHTIGQ